MLAIVREYCVPEISRARSGESLSSGPPNSFEQETRPIASSATPPALNSVLRAERHAERLLIDVTASTPKYRVVLTKSSTTVSRYPADSKRVEEIPFE
jgi:hypothetical protein